MDKRLFSCALAWMIGAAVAVAAITGCGPSGPKSYPVTGKVTFQGEPVSKGMIRCCNLEKGVDVTAKLDPEGHYEIITSGGPGMPEGIYQVAIMPGAQSASMGTFEASPAPKRSDIPEKYRHPATSRLTLTVTPSPNEFDVEMHPDR